METGRALVNEFVVVPLQAALQQLLSFAPVILGALLILLIGGVIAKVLEQLITRGLKAIGADKLAEEVQLARILTRGGVRRKFSELVGAFIYWIVMLAFVMTALNALQLTVAAQLLQALIEFLPNVLAAVFMLVVGIFVAVFVSTTVRTAAINLGVYHAQLLSEAVQTIIIVFAIAAALQQLRIQFVGEAFLIILAGVSLALGLAFGLGCKDQVGRWVSSLTDQLQAARKK
jgi:hypothetical protein